MSTQAHNHFKFFQLQFENNKIEEEGKNQLVKFLNGNDIIAKSVGIEHLDNDQKVIICIGYAIEENNKTFDIELKKIGKFEGDSSLSSLEGAMNKAASSYTNIICHEFFIDEEKDLYTIFLLER